MLYGMEVLGGQYFFKGDRGNVTGSVSGFAVPVVYVNENWTLAPSWSSRYQGTKQAVDLVGAGSLFAQQMTHRAAAKAIYRKPDSKWAQKGALGYSLQLLKETKDESWFDGLFDYQAVDAGYEAEYFYAEPYSVGFGADVFITHYPNYTSLESQIATDFNGQSLARELVGDNILDSRTLAFRFALTGKFRESTLYEMNARLLRTTFPQQQVVDGRGLYSAETREDIGAEWDVSLSRPQELGVALLWTPSVFAGVRNNVSNQNSYDALRPKYQSGYYNFTQWSVGQGATFDFADLRQPIKVSLNSTLSFRKYPNRKTQDNAGTYLGDALTQRRWSLDVTAGYPISPHLRLIFQFEYDRSLSNQAFEQFYSYNYASTNYMGGFRYEY